MRQPLVPVAGTAARVQPEQQQGDAAADDGAAEGSGDGVAAGVQVSGVVPAGAGEAGWFDKHCVFADVLSVLLHCVGAAGTSLV
jgi:hypothetical protein